MTTPANGAATWSGLARSAFSAVGISLAMLRSRTTTGRSWPLKMHITVRMPRSSGSEIASKPDQQLDAALELHAVLVTVAQPVEELVGRQAGRVAVEFSMRLEFLCRPGEQQPVQRGLAFRASLRQHRLVLGS